MQISMNKIKVDNLTFEKIFFDISDIQDGVKISFKGSIDMEYPQLTLDDFFNQIHEACIQENIKNVYCDFHNLSYINSSGIRCIVKWIMNLIKMSDTEHKYKMTFIISNDYEWQAASLGFLAKLNPGLIKVKNKYNY